MDALSNPWAEAAAEARKRAEAFVAARRWGDSYYHCVTRPDNPVASSDGSGHPLTWRVVFAPVPPPGGVIDGGELVVAVDLGSGAVAVHRWSNIVERGNATDGRA
ncbi:MAG: hypothetical protein ACRC7O_02900 [Fimbriiglobus sp.]